MIFKTRQAAGLSFVTLSYCLLGSVLAQSIYTCVDDKGRKLTSDRPIAECMNRAQNELNPSGSLRRVLAPPPTAKDRAALEEKEKEKEKVDAEARSQHLDEKRRDRVLVTRYPDRASHDKQRMAALEVVDDVIKTATKRTLELTDQRKTIGTELDFYKSSPGKVPPAIKRRLEETDTNLATQKRLITDHEAEKKRITERFDTEATKLKPQWSVAEGSAAAGPANSAKKP